MSDIEAYGQAFENGRSVGEAEGYARGLFDALRHNPCEYCGTDRDGYSAYLPRVGTGNAHIWGIGEKYAIKVSGPNKTKFEIPISFCPQCGRKLGKQRHV